MHVAIGIRRFRFSIPLGPALLASVLARAGHRVSLFEFGAARAKWLRRLSEDPPGLAAYSVLSGEQGDCLAFHACLTRGRAIPSILGGPHPTFFPRILLEEGVDAVCVGEGEEALPEFVGRLEAEGAIPRDVANIRVRDGRGGVAENPPRPPVGDLDSLPHPDRGLFEAAHPLLLHHGIRHFMARRGCPHGCTFCFNGAYRRIHGGTMPPIRARDPEAVCDEVDAVRKGGRLRMAAFVDDSFAHDPAWVERFCDAYARRIPLPFSCNLRADDAIPRLAPRLASAGCRLAYVGVEAGALESRRLLGRPMPEGVIREAIGALHRSGIRTITENMVGIPGERFEQAVETLRLNAAMGPTAANCSIFTPYPGLPLTEYAVRHGWFDGDFDRLEGGYYRTSALKYRSRAERNMTVNLRAFFGLLARHPGLIGPIRPLLRLPPNRLFELAGTLADGYFLRKCLPYRPSATDSARLLAAYLDSYR
jgi:hypothetical protein